MQRGPSETLQHTATHCSTLQHTATHCNTLQHTATHCNALHYSYTLQHAITVIHCNTLQHTTTHYTLQHTITALHCNARNLLNTPTIQLLTQNCRQRTTTHYSTLQHTITHCNALQHTEPAQHAKNPTAHSLSHEPIITTIQYTTGAAKGTPGFLGISRYKFKLRFWFNLNLYRGI